MDITSASVKIRSNNENFVYSRRRDLLQLGFAVTETEEFQVDQRNTVYSFTATVPFDQAQKLERNDDRWQVANLFFQKAEQDEHRSGVYARAANDWTAFDYKYHSLQEHLDIQRDTYGR